MGTAWGVTDVTRMFPGTYCSHCGETKDIPVDVYKCPQCGKNVRKTPHNSHTRQKYLAEVPRI
jgi:transposase